MIKGIKPRVPEGGKIKIGGLGEKVLKRGGDPNDPNDFWRRPVKHDHFTITKTTRDVDGNLELDAELMQALRDDQKLQPTAKLVELPIIVHSDVIDEVFPTAYAAYAGKKLWCSGDGEVAWRNRVDPKKGKVVDKIDKCALNNCPYRVEPKYRETEREFPHCKPHGKLHCSLAVRGHALAGSVHLWRTVSIISIEHMIASLQHILHTVGTLKGIPLTLKLEQITVSPPGSERSVKVYVCHVELRAKDVLGVQRQAIDAARMRSMAGGEFKPLVEAPGAQDEDEDEQADAAETFHPPDSAELDPDAPEVQRISELVDEIARAKTGNAVKSGSRSSYESTFASIRDRIARETYQKHLGVEAGHLPTAFEAKAMIDSLQKQLREENAL